MRSRNAPGLQAVPTWAARNSRFSVTVESIHTRNTPSFYWQPMRRQFKKGVTMLILLNKHAEEDLESL